MEKEEAKHLWERRLGTVGRRNGWMDGMNQTLVFLRSSMMIASHGSEQHAAQK
jgi:hypothetical protein